MKPGICTQCIVVFKKKSLSLAPLISLCFQGYVSIPDILWIALIGHDPAIAKDTQVTLILMGKEYMLHFPMEISGTKLSNIH